MPDIFLNLVSNASQANMITCSKCDKSFYLIDAWTKGPDDEDYYDYSTSAKEGIVVTQLWPMPTAFHCPFCGAKGAAKSVEFIEMAKRLAAKKAKKAAGEGKP